MHWTSWGTTVDRWRERRELFAEQDRYDHPEWKMIGTESGTIFSFDEQYSLGTDPEVVRPNYTSGMLQAERLWKWVEMRDWFAGNFMWTGIDYLGESTWPFKGFGAMDITGHPKDAYYLYRSLDRFAGASPLPALELVGSRGPGHPGAGLHQLQHRRALPQRPFPGKSGSSFRRREPRAAGTAMRSRSSTPRPATCI